MFLNINIFSGFRYAARAGTTASSSTSSFHTQSYLYPHDARRLIESSREVQDQVVKDVGPDTAAFANVLLRLAHSENALTLEANILGFFKALSPDPKLREASSKAQELFDDFVIETSMREDSYGLVDAVLRRERGYTS